MLISVIVPVYNIEDYLKECVESVIAQSYKTWECILVDDGSKDTSSIICEEYSANYENIHVIHKENEGPSAARNTGLLKSRGEYVFFLDGDDKLTADALEHFASFVNREEKLDMVLGHMAYFTENSSPVPFKNIVKEEWVRNRSGKEAFISIHRNMKTLMMGARGIYRREFLLNNNLIFKESCSYSEDQEWTVRCFIKATSLSSNERADYLYRQGRAGSLMNTIDIRKIEMVLQTYDAWHELVMKNSNDEFFKCLYFVLLDRFWEFYFKYPSMLKKEDVKRFCKMMDERKKYVRNKPLDLKDDLHMKLIRFFKCKTLCRMTKIWLKIKG